ncbi:MAG: YARHG domain-containing protein [Siculibacillus sp.]
MRTIMGFAVIAAAMLGGVGTAAAMSRDGDASCVDVGCGSTEAFSPGQVASWSCNDLYMARNAIYYANGYCFKTERGIATFGNEGCRWRNDGDVPMSRLERRNVDLIRREERARGCR